jgi:hypothetical protein
MSSNGVTSLEQWLGIRDGKVTGASVHVDRDDGLVRHNVEVSPRKGWFRRRAPRQRRPRWQRQPGDGARLVSTAMTLLFVLAAGLLTVSFAAQYRYVLAERHQRIASVIEALSADLGLMILSLLALGLARKGKSAIPERWGIIAVAGLSAAMNYAAASDGDWRSVLAYCAPSVFLAYVVDRTVSVIRRHVLGMEDERSPFVLLGRALARVGKFLAVVTLYTLRVFLAPVETPRGLRRVVLNATPLPAEPAAVVADVTVIAPRAISQVHGALAGGPDAKTTGRGRTGPRGPRSDSKATRLVAAADDRYGPLATFPLDRVSPVCKELAPEVGMDPGWARTVLRKAVISAYAQAREVPPQHQEEGK